LINARGFPGNREEAQRAGITAITLDSIDMRVDQPLSKGHYKNFQIKQ
jgi:hypothetical protein